jgi:hypothetical protein
MESESVCTCVALRQGLSLLSRCAALVAAGPFVLVAPAAAQNSTKDRQAFANAIEWKLPPDSDIRPGAIAVDLTGDGNRIWFVTRVGEVRVYRLELRGGKRVNKANFLSWSLDQNSVTTGGLKRIKSSKDQRFVFVRTTEAIQRVDTGTCPTKTVPDPITPGATFTGPVCDGTTWLRQQVVDAQGAADATPIDTSGTSDVAVDDNNNVYVAFSAGPDPSTIDATPNHSFIQKLNPGLNTFNITRWYVGGGAGLCGTTVAPFQPGSDPCLSGVTVNPRNQSLVYYAEPTGGVDSQGILNNSGAIGELDTVKNVVRRWSLADLKDPSIRDPRQLIFDNDGRIWTVTGSGHLVSLDPRNNRMSKHSLPDGQLNDLFGVAPDGGVIGYTAAAEGFSKVAMLLPKRNEVPPITPTTFPVARRPFTTPPDPFDAIQMNGQASPVAKTIAVRPGTTPEGSRVVEALTETATLAGTMTPAPSTSPLGIIPDGNAAVGTFFYAVGMPDDFTSKMIGRIRLRKDVGARIERDDDDIDDDGKRADVDDDVDDDGIPNTMDADNDNDGTSDLMDADDDDDGIEDDFDTKDKKETKQTSQQDVAAGSSAQDVFTVNPGTLLVVASATSTDLLASLVVEIVNSAGQVVASSLPTPGAAAVTFVPPSAGGTYTLRVKNPSFGLSTISTKILTRELWPLVLGGGL